MHIHGAGLGLRREFSRQLLAKVAAGDIAALPDFLEIAPENWIGFGGGYAEQLLELSQYFPVACHGLSLSIGGPQPLDINFLQRLAGFFKRYNISTYSEHLSYTHDGQGYLYDLMPMPMSEEAVHYVAKRIAKVQDVLGMRIAIENVSTYLRNGDGMSEIDFIKAVLSEADCDLLLDVNNVYVNHVNHGMDPHQFISQLPTERVRYMHVAGHYPEAVDLLIDTHGNDVCAEVWQLLKYAYSVHGIKPTLLERDFNIPPLEVLLGEWQYLKMVQNETSTA